MNTQVNNEKSELLFREEDRVHGTADFPFSLYTNGDPGGFDYNTVADPHWHHEAEFVLITEGTASVTVGSFEFTAPKGTIFLIQPQKLHSIYPTAGRMSFYAAVFDLKLITCGVNDVCQLKYTPLFFSDTNMQSLLFYPILNEKHAKHEIWSELIYSMKKVIFLYRERPIGFEIGIKAYLLQMLYSMVTNKCFEQVVDAHRRTAIERVHPCLEYIRMNYTKDIRIDDIARAGNMSKFHLCRLFKEVTGKTPLDYVSFVRVQNSISLLLNTSMSILDIALEVGYQDASYFSRVFRRYAKDTPSNYRRNIKKDESNSH